MLRKLLIFVPPWEKHAFNQVFTEQLLYSWQHEGLKKCHLQISQGLGGKIKVRISSNEESSNYLHQSL